MSQHRQAAHVIQRRRPPVPATRAQRRQIVAAIVGLGFTTPSGATSIRAVHWADVTVPGSACGGDQPIHLHRGNAYTPRGGRGMVAFVGGRHRGVRMWQQAKQR